MKILEVNPYHKPRVRDIPDTLEEYQRIVGGYIEVVNPFADNAVIVCNEEGKLLDLPENRFLWVNGRLVDVIQGSFFIVGVDGVDFCDLTQDQIDKYMKLFLIPDFARRG